MYKERDLTGMKFGKLTVVKPIGYKRKNDKHFWSLVKCDCGEFLYVQDTKLTSNLKKQCPKCSNKDRQTHGMGNTSLFHVWSGMKSRCYNKNNKSYIDYGGRGIVVYDEWRNEFEAFAKWAFNNGYKDGLTIDRIDVNGNYEPDNCRWATSKEQARNKRNTIYVEYNGEKLPVQYVAEIVNIKPSTIIARIKSGWSDYEATHIMPKSNESYTRTPSMCLKKGVHIKNIKNGNEMYFNSCSEASMFLGFNKGYIGNRTKKYKTNSFTVGDYYVETDEYYHKI